MELNQTSKVLEGYRKIKKTFDEFKKVKGFTNTDRLILDIEGIKKNLRKSLVIKQLNNGYSSRDL